MLSWETQRNLEEQITDDDIVGIAFCRISWLSVCTKLYANIVRCRFSMAVFPKVYWS